ncbi:MAG: GNAT family N-acetyltransferase [Coriobacteriales bacterium]|nr:GNAT family N-acetyltransferase [Coriobacteriales bacterium]
MADSSRIGLRLASREDAGFILAMIRDLADYEHALDEVHATADLLEQWLFDTPVAECLIASLDGVDRGIALFFTNFSTWEARPGIFLEDLYVQPEARKHGLGLALFRELARLALERGYTRLDWNCYDWNEPSLAFYRSLGAIARTEWIPHRLTLEAMKALVLC